VYFPFASIDLPEHSGDAVAGCQADVEDFFASIDDHKVTRSGAVDVRAMQNLPLLDRQFLNLALTVAGTVPVETFTVAGMRSQSDNYTLDGIGNNDPHMLSLRRLSRDSAKENSVGLNGRISLATRSPSTGRSGRAL
jgi:hypothetical protein